MNILHIYFELLHIVLVKLKELKFERSCLIYLWNITAKYQICRDPPMFSTLIQKLQSLRVTLSNYFYRYH